MKNKKKIRCEQPMVSGNGQYESPDDEPKLLKVAIGKANHVCFRTDTEGIWSRFKRSQDDPASRWHSNQRPNQNIANQKCFETKYSKVLQNQNFKNKNLN
jgi:hypothetical protein